jgi:RND family efflux transporter MFP subunit
VMAPIAAVHVSPGDRVRRGTVLVTLDAREAAAHRAAAGAAVTSAANAARAAEADVRSASAAATLARATFTRIDTLVARKSATPQELDQAAAGLAAAEAQLQSAQARLAASNASREAASHAREAADVGVSYSTLLAPFDGLVTERHADPGSMAMPGAALLVVEDTMQYRVEAALDAARAGQMAVGDPVDVRLDSAPDAGWVTTRLVEIGRVDPTSHSFLVKADLPGPARSGSGRFGRLRIAGPSRQALTLPATAAVRRGQLTFVYLVGADGVARLRPVTTGETTADITEVLAGLRAGDRVVASPDPALGDGARVAPDSSPVAPPATRGGRS